MGFPMYTWSHRPFSPVGFTRLNGNPTELTVTLPPEITGPLARDGDRHGDRWSRASDSSGQRADQFSWISTAPTGTESGQGFRTPPVPTRDPGHVESSRDRTSEWV